MLSFYDFIYFFTLIPCLTDTIYSYPKINKKYIISEISDKNYTMKNLA